MTTTDEIAQLATQENDGKTDIHGPWWRWPARILAVVVLGFAAYLVAIQSGDRECSTVTKTTTQDPRKSVQEVTETCEIKTATTVEVLPLILLGLILIAGEFSEMTISGLVTVKRQVEKQEEAIADQAERQERLEAQLIQVQTLAQNQSVSVSTYMEPRHQSPQVVEAEIQDKIAEGERRRTPEVETGVTKDASPELTYDVLLRYERLSPFIALGLSQAPEITASRNPAAAEVLPLLSSSQLERLHSWSRKYRTEIESVRAVRNSAAHPPTYLTRDDVEATLSTMTALEGELRRIGIPLTETVAVPEVQ